MAQCVSAVKANTIFTATENAEERSTPTSSSAWSRGRLFLRIAIGCRGRKAGLGHAGLCLRLRQTRIGAKALSWCVSITVGSRMWRLNVTVLEQSVPTIEADTSFLRTKDAWESAWVPRISIKEVRASNRRRFQWLLKRKNIRRINLRCYVNRLPYRGG